MMMTAAAAVAMAMMMIRTFHTGIKTLKRLTESIGIQAFASTVILRLLQILVRLCARYI